jgi:soluble lytic murein transglycosylase-like protein
MTAPTPITRYALPVAFLLLCVAVWGMTRGGDPAAPAPANTGAGYIVPVVTLDSLLTTSASEVVSSSDIPDAFLVVDESATQHAEAVEALVARGAYSTPPQAPTASATPHQLEVTPALPVEAASKDTGLGFAYLADLIERTWPAHRHSEVLSVVQCESSGDASAVGDGGWAIGLMQIRIDYWPHLASAYDLTDAEQNLRAGRQAFVEWQQMFNESGWRAWSCRPGGE